MHTHTTDDGYDWPTCGACARPLWEQELGRIACRPCEDKTRTRLAAIPGLFTHANTTAALMRGTVGKQGNVSGSRTPPIPPDVRVLNLVAPGGAATRLAAIEDAWRQALGWTMAPWRGNARQAVPEHVRFLVNNLPWAVDAYESVGQDVEEVRQLHAELGAALDPTKRAGRVKVGLCPIAYDDGTQCGAQLTASTGSPRIRCGDCGSEWPDMAAWRELRLAQEAATRDHHMEAAA
ncbi:hypothetical protein [Streptomyces qinglanensis]|uniref:Uncharacterized protein n=1 Tax=Streptomyces qinglanensis TaxID=943816 RepID=A0A1H9U3K0_9ACTN|nr:hypothetical protein [Streptomyces qinglanensis]SES03653.1 hypothetical protein SAMN05421870_107257 [Streptomyces qinglanensis]